MFKNKLLTHFVLTFNKWNYNANLNLKKSTQNLHMNKNKRALSWIRKFMPSKINKFEAFRSHRETMLRKKKEKIDT